MFSLLDIDVLPDVHLNLTANQLVLSDNVSINVTCISSLNSSSTINWHRLSGTQQQSGVNGTILTTTNMISKLQLTIAIADLKNPQSTCVEYYCSAHNSLGTARSRSLSLCRPCEYMKNSEILLHKSLNLPLFPSIPSVFCFTRVWRVLHSIRCC